ncbi:type II toxin-antitoxin system RelE/ParE family toxin [Xanthobacter autotrophicus]|uniref:type II toxin-antitoxin system RelE/ParE family toxin n=1 Tax=Xanthobacter autotrophicus TaxID=280 RepID=UPI00372657B1
MKLRFTARALADIAAIAAHIKRDSPAAADRALAAIEAATERLLRFPHLGRPTDEADVRELHVARWPYLIYYLTAGEEIILLHVRHAAQRPWSGSGEDEPA